MFVVNNFMKIKTIVLVLLLTFMQSVIASPIFPNTIDRSKLQDRNGIWYTVNETEPFSGAAVKFKSSKE